MPKRCLSDYGTRVNNMAAQYGFGSTHSAQWLWRIQKTDRFYFDLMEKLDLNPTP